MTDTEFFYFRTMDLKNPSENPSYEIRKVSNQWRSCIRYGYLTKEADKLRDWDSCKLKALSAFMRLYAQWIVFQGYFVIAHRGYISIYTLHASEIADVLKPFDDSPDKSFCHKVSTGWGRTYATNNLKKPEVDYVKTYENDKIEEEKRWVTHMKVDE